MRPQVQALISKLREMKVVKEPGVPEEIIWDMAFWHLHRNGEEVRLASIAGRITALWVGMVKNDEGQAAYVFGQHVPPVEDVPAEPAGDSPSFEAQLKAFLVANDSKVLMEEVIENHIPKVGRPAWQIHCTCGRSYAHTEEWRKHVRIRLTRALTDTFAPGDTDG